MKQTEWNNGLNHLESDIVEKYIEQKEKMAAKKKQKHLWLRFGAIAACFCLIVSTILIIPLFNRNTVIQPYMPDGGPWSPIISSKVKNVILSAKDIHGIFDVPMDSFGTNQYTEVYVSSAKYLNLSPLPNAEHLPIYSLQNTVPTGDTLESFISQYLDSATALFGIDSHSYEIEPFELWNGTVAYRANMYEDRNRLCFFARGNLLELNYYASNEDRIILNGNRISVLESDSDEQIKAKLQNTIASICNAFHKEYTHVKIQRSYSSQQLKMITVYLYTPEKTIFPENFSKAPMTSDYIFLTFYTDWGKGTLYHWGGEPSEAYLCDFSLCETLNKWSDVYDVMGKAKMVTLEEAEDLLKKGYVFGGHSCSLCMASQPDVDFSNYNYVGMEYVSDRDRKLYIPFYTFYKGIGTTRYGMIIYAKTYVAAIEVSGYEEFFQTQMGNHNK